MIEIHIYQTYCVGYDATDYLYYVFESEGFGLYDGYCTEDLTTEMLDLVNNLIDRCTSETVMLHKTVKTYLNYILGPHVENIDFSDGFLSVDDINLYLNDTEVVITLMVET